MLNSIVLMGRLVKDPELRRTQSGIAVASFRLAVDRDYANQQTGQREADFIDVVAWRSTGEFVSKYFAKGRMAVVSGRLQMRNWTDNNGQKRTSAEVVAENVYFGESKRDSDGGSSYGGSYGGSYAGGSNYAAPSSPAGYGAPSSPAGYGAPSSPAGYGAQSGAPGSQTPMAGDFALLEDDDSELPF